MNKKIVVFLVIIFLLGAWVRWVPYLKSPYPLGMDAYGHGVYGRHVLENGVPANYDELSWQGKTFVYPPLWHYTIAFFMFVLQDEFALSVIGVIFGLLSVLVFYFVIRKDFNDKRNALIALILILFSSAVLIKTTTNALVTSLAPCLMFLYFYFLDKDLKKTLLFAVLYAFLHSSVLLLIPLSIFYILLKKFKKIKLNKKEVKGVIYSILLILIIWGVIHYPLLKAGSINWIPEEIRREAIEKIGFMEFLYRLSYLPIALFIPGILSKKRNYWIDAMLLVFGISFAFNLMETDRALYYLIFCLAFYSSRTFDDYVKSKKIFWSLAVILLIVMVPIGYSSLERMDWGIVEKEDVDAYKALRDTPKGSTVLGEVVHGFRIEYFAQRKNFINGDTALVPQIKERFNDLPKMLCGDFQLLEKWNIDYIFIKKNRMEELGCEHELDIFYENDKVIVFEV